MTSPMQSLPGDQDTLDVCIPNINRAERVKRLTFGIVTAAVSLAILAALALLHTDRWWRLALFPLYVAAATGFFQWRDKT